VDGQDIGHPGAETLFDLSNEYAHVQNSVEGAVAPMNKGEQVLAVEVAAIQRLGPIVAVVWIHDLVAGNESSGRVGGSSEKTTDRVGLCSDDECRPVGDIRLCPDRRDGRRVPTFQFSAVSSCLPLV